MFDFVKHLLSDICSFMRHYNFLHFISLSKIIFKRNYNFFFRVIRIILNYLVVLSALLDISLLIALLGDIM